MPLLHQVEIPAPAPDGPRPVELWLKLMILLSKS